MGHTAMKNTSSRASLTDFVGRDFRRLNTLAAEAYEAISWGTWRHLKKSSL
jgi:hypothetical protein